MECVKFDSLQFSKIQSRIKSAGNELQFSPCGDMTVMKSSLYQRTFPSHPAVTQQAGLSSNGTRASLNRQGRWRRQKMRWNIEVWNENKTYKWYLRFVFYSVITWHTLLMWGGGGEIWGWCHVGKYKLIFSNWWQTRAEYFLILITNHRIIIRICNYNLSFSPVQQISIN